MLRMVVQVTVVGLSLVAAAPRALEVGGRGRGPDKLQVTHKFRCGGNQTTLKVEVLALSRMKIESADLNGMPLSVDDISKMQTIADGLGRVDKILGDCSSKDTLRIQFWKHPTGESGHEVRTFTVR